MLAMIPAQNQCRVNVPVNIPMVSTHTRTLRACRRPAPQTVQELIVRAHALAGWSIAEIAHALHAAIPDHPLRAKGFVGQLAECALGADPLAGERPDFPMLGVELKTIPVNQHGMPTEGTFCCSIDMMHTDTEVWETSRLKQRLQQVLWLPVDSAKRAPLPERRFGRAVLWTPSTEQLAVLRADWEDLMGAIGAGRAGTLSAREGVALQVRPKAANARVRALAAGPDGPYRTLPLGFYLRTSFTRDVLGFRDRSP